ncbi:MAG: alpha/beta hydrolase [Salibacteraceae bacterium]|nr:alpha/beta hydrolase [Salibacteraceae bacterium]MDP4844388.1 alpha/beta hydrolase [Salibacteraceae bacterium]
MRTLMTVIAVLMLSSCIRLDSLMFSPDTSIKTYQLDAFEGRQEIDLPEAYALPDSLIEVFTLESDLEGDKAEIYAVYVGNQNLISTDTVILYLHGNAGHLDFYWNRIKLLANTGAKNRFGVLAIDYRGYGLSGGTPSEEGLYADTDAAMKWLKEKGLTSDRLVIYGFSMGSAPATELTANPRTLQPSKLMLEAPFASDEVMLQDASGLSLPGSYISNLEINNADEIAKVDEPFFWIHGVDDDYLSIETHGEVVFKNYQGIYSEAHRIEGANHGDVPFIMGFEEYIDAVTQFVER